MRIVYHIFDLLNERQITQKKFREDLNIPGGLLQRIRHNESVTMDTIGKICEYLGCQPSDIVEIVYDVDVQNRQQEKNNVEAQIAELQAKLKTM